MPNQMESKDSSGLQARLKGLGFEQVDLEPKVSNRFIVKIDGLPSYVIKGIHLPMRTLAGWEQRVELECYNPLDAKLENTVIELIRRGEVKIKIQILTPTADIDTEWDIVGWNGEISFGSLNWSNKGDANLIHVTFEVKSATISYPQKS